MGTTASGGNLVLFTTRSQRLAIDIMETLGMKESIIKSFKEDGRVLRTNYINYLRITQSELTESDITMISDLNQNGILVYHILQSMEMDGQIIDIVGDFGTSFFERIITMKCYLCVQKEIVGEVDCNDDYEDKVSQRQEVLIKNSIDNSLFMAKQGYLYAYVINDANTIPEFSNIEVTLISGNLVKVN